MPLGENAVKQRLRDVAVGLLTPFDHNGEIEHWKIAENTRAHYEKGVQTFLAAANISEYHALSQSERIDVAETSIEALPSDACVLAGVGGSTECAQELIRSYDRIGIDAMMIMPPDHTYLHEQGVLDYYERLASVTDTPIVPYVRGFDPSVEFLTKLSYLDSVAGIKYALEDPVKLGTASRRGASDVVWVNGLAEPYAVAYWPEGIEGFSAGVSNFRPEVGLALHEALSNENWSRARELRDICLPYQQFRDKPGQDSTIAGGISIPAVKQGLELAGMHGGAVREPIRPLTETEVQHATELYNQLDDEISRLVE
ncbi:dihydrodipicolinate synthase family protein [Haloarcula laminariae]|uniref:dihydrodipicolinate synthase family protein n=1 Tax=Haloarcula laminariae TaxID=2961577 RepID=UPI0021C9ABF7|nr:dihydrodipicolinate synthase family protein [Halomicroarcula laminariae]